MCKWCEGAIPRKGYNETAWRARKFCTPRCYQIWRKWHAILEKEWPKGHEKL